MSEVKCDIGGDSNRRLLLIIIFYILGLLLYAIISKIWLISQATKSSIIFVQGGKPVAAPAFYSLNDGRYAWSTILSKPHSPILPYDLIPLIEFLFPSNLSWIVHEVLFPVVGGTFFALYMISFLRIFTDNSVFLKSKLNKNTLLAGFMSGLMYETILLSPWLDIWTEAFRSILPVVLFLATKVLTNIKNSHRAVVFSMLTGLAVSWLYDVRIILASMVLISLLWVIYLLNIRSKPLHINLSIKKRLSYSFMIILIVPTVLAFLPFVVQIALKSSNPLGGIRTLTLPVIVGNYDVISSLGLPFPPLQGIQKLTSPILFFAAFVLGLNLVYKKPKSLHRSSVILTLVLVTIVLIIYEASPLKIIQKELTEINFFGSDVGVLFRTPRFFTTIEETILSMLVGMLVYTITYSMSSKRLKRNVKSVILLVLIIVDVTYMASLNVCLNNNDAIKPAAQKASPLPGYYNNIADILKNTINNTNLYRVLWIPRTGKYGDERPPWLKSICWGIGEQSFPIRTYRYIEQPMEYLYQFIVNIAKKNETKTLHQILAYLGVKYVVVTVDYSSKEKRDEALTIATNLRNSPYFHEIFITSGKYGSYTAKLYIFKNIGPEKPIRLTSKAILIEGGLRTLAEAIQDGLNISNIMIVFADEILPFKVLKCTNIIIVNSEISLKMDLITQMIYWKKINGTIIIPSKYTLGIDPYKWHPSFITDPHHAEWEVFYTWGLKGKGRYDLDFRHDWGFVIANKLQSLDVPLKVDKNTEYIIAVRYLKSTMGGEFILRLDNKIIGRIITIGDNNAFQWAILQIPIHRGIHTLTLENLLGHNAINVILLIPKSAYLNGINYVKKLLENKTIIDINAKAKKPLYQSLTLLHKESGTHLLLGYTFKNNKYVIYIGTHNVTEPLYLLIPEQWYPEWIAICGTKKSFSFSSLFIVAFSIRKENLNNIGSSEPLKIEVIYYGDVVAKYEYYFSLIFALLIISLGVTEGVRALCKRIRSRQ